MSTGLSKKDSQLENGGFTILELLVVVAIIGIISALGLALLSDTRARSRDARRLSDIREIEKALHLYYSENNSFPISVSATTITGTDGLSNTLEAAGHIEAVPSDPQPGSYEYTYITNDKGTSFTISFCLETDTVQTFQQGCSNSVSP